MHLDSSAQGAFSMHLTAWQRKLTMKRLVTFMRKILACLLVLLCLLLCSAALAENMTFTEIYAGVTIPDTYIILTRHNLAQHPEWLEKHQATSEALQEDWKARGVQLQAWSKVGDVCIEITVVKDDRAMQYYDMDQQTVENRKVFRLSHSSGAYYRDEGYVYETADWVNSKKIGRFLDLKYRRTTATESYRGLQRRTIRNGYTITVDYQVYGRNPKAADKTALDKIMGTWHFDQLIPRPANAVAKIVFTSQPPKETNTGKFTLAGTGDPGLHILGVAMRMSSSDKVPMEATIGKNGKFSIDVLLPREGVWLVTMVVDNNGVETEQIVFDITTYQKRLLVVNMDTELPEKLTSDKVIVSGKTLPGTTVELMVGDSYQKQVRAGNNGVYKFTVDTSNEGEYQMILTFQKKNYDSRRFETVATRKLSQQDIADHARAVAVKPSYANLVEKIKGYTGRVLNYSMYVASISKSGDEWVVFLAMNSTKNGYKDMIVATTDEEPKLEVGKKYHVYGTCTGTYLVQNAEEGDKYYPCMDLLFWEN